MYVFCDQNCCWKKCISALSILWMLMSRKQVCCLAVCSSGFLGLWIPLYIDDIGINLFIQAHLWKIHVCSKDLSPWIHIGGCMSTSRIGQRLCFLKYSSQWLSIWHRKNKINPLDQTKFVGKFWVKIMPVLRLLLPPDSDKLR